MNGYRVVAKIQTRFRDTDAMGHVNNAVYLSYLELARMEYIKKVFGITHYSGVDFILARVEIDYRSPSFAGEELEVGIRISRVGGASFNFHYRIEEASSKRLVAEAQTVQVAYDYKAGKVKRVAKAFKEKTEAFDGAAR